MIVNFPRIILAVVGLCAVARTVQGETLYNVGCGFPDKKGASPCTDNEKKLMYTACKAALVDMGYKELTKDPNWKLQDSSGNLVSTSDADSAFMSMLNDGDIRHRELCAGQYWCNKMPQTCASCGCCTGGRRRLLRLKPEHERDLQATAAQLNANAKARFNRNEIRCADPELINSYFEAVVV